MSQYSNFNIRGNPDLNMSKEKFLVRFSNYSYGDRSPVLGLVRSRTASGLTAAGVTGGTKLSISPINNVEAQQPGTVQSVDLIQRTSDYQASSDVMKEIIKGTIAKQNRAYHMRTPQVDTVPKAKKQGREIGKRVRQAKSKEASIGSIVEDYQRLKTKKGKGEFIFSLGQIYKANPTGSEYILKGIEAIKNL